MPFCCVKFIPYNLDTLSILFLKLEFILNNFSVNTQHLSRKLLAKEWVIHFKVFLPFKMKRTLEHPCLLFYSHIALI